MFTAVLLMKETNKTSLINCAPSVVRAAKHTETVVETENVVSTSVPLCNARVYGVSRVLALL